MTSGQSIEIGPFTFTVIRMLVAVGIIRILIRGERPEGGLSGLDWTMFLWAAWALFSAAFHKTPQETLITHLGMVYNTLGIFFLIRCFCQSEEDVCGLVKITAILLIPVALAMLNEQLSHRNVFSILGGVPETPNIRHGRFRSQGPFQHAILAGTVGAVCAPLMIGIWRNRPLIAKAGLIACLLIVVTSASSGPMMSLIFSAIALILWPWRHLTRWMCISAVFGYLLIELVMKTPAYYLIARIDLAGGSTGWHRARLIESALEHLSEWWWAGTDHTRHWMATGVPWSADHADITNHYLYMGVLGGLPLMLLFIQIVRQGFRYVGEGVHLRSEASLENRFFFWSLGSSLFANATTCISVSCFDQSFIFLYLTLALIVSLRTAARAEAGVEFTPVVGSPDSRMGVEMSPSRLRPGNS